jgi:hypothetical protein
MEIDRLGKPMFTRTYHHGDGRELVVRIWNPNKTQAPMFCWYQMGDAKLQRVPGMDPLGALFTAMRVIEMHLSHIRKTTDKDLHWKGALNEGELGLPTFYPNDEKQDEPPLR